MPAAVYDRHIGIRVDTDTYKKLQVIAVDRDESISDVLRAAIGIIVETETPPPRRRKIAEQALAQLAGE
jgi:hypothetical protein